MLSPNLAVFLSLGYSFTVNLALFEILDTISKQKDELSAKNFTSTLNIFQVCKVSLSVLRSLGQPDLVLN